jgi:wobble nucleotide-excising tRNase
MLRRVIAIKNVGRFRNSAATPNPGFEKHTFIFAGNGFGKTTFSVVMRSAQSGDAAPVLGRQTLGSSHTPEIDLLFADGNRRLQNGTWSATAPRISVFDGAFVAANVHSGDVVEVSHTAGVIRPYENRINHYLDLFNAGFKIVRTDHGYPGGIATSTYQLSIADIPVDLGDSRTPIDRPSFKNTLSAGDRATLALAFFLAHLERELDLAERIVILDDPFTSQDAFRRHQTIYEIMRAANACAQIVVLSHDANFLQHLWQKCPTDQRAAMQIIYHPATGSKLAAFDLDDACRGRARAELDDLLAFREQRVPEISAKLSRSFGLSWRRSSGQIFPGASCPRTISAPCCRRSGPAGPGTPPTATMKRLSGSTTIRRTITTAKTRAARPNLCSIRPS